MKINKSSLGIWFPLVISNHFYFSSIINYKVLFILGLGFLWNRIRISVLISILIILILQTISIYYYSEAGQEDIIFLFSSTFMAFGLYGWASEGLKRGMLNLSPILLILLSIASLIAPSRGLYLSLDPLILFVLYQSCCEQRGLNLGYIPFFIYLIFSILMGWRAAILGLLGGMYYFAINKASKPIKIMLVVMGVILIWAIYEFFISDIFDLLLSTGTAGDPTSGRLALYVNSILVFFEGIRNLEWGAFFGYGFNSPARLFDNTLETTIDLFGIEINSIKAVEDKTRLHMHNLFLQPLFEFGLFGLSFYLYTLWRFFRHSKKLAIFTVVGVLSGSLSGTMYFYSSYYIILAALYFHERNHNQPQS